MKWWAWLIPVGAAAAVYAPSINGELVWDDTIVQKDQMVAFKTVRDAFFFDAQRIHEFSPYYYRPMVTLSYMVDRELGAWLKQKGTKNAETRVQHATSILFHIVTTFFVWLLARQILRGSAYAEWGALAAGLIFAVHPIHTESVCMINGRSDPLAAMFLLPALVAVIRYGNRPAVWAVVVSTLLFFGALISKEVAVTALLLLPVVFFCLRRREAAERAGDGGGEPGADVRDRAAGRDAASARIQGGARVGMRDVAGALGSRVGRIVWSLPFLMYIGAICTYFALRESVNMRYGQPMSSATSGELFERFCGALAYYMGKLVFPWPQSHFPAGLPRAALGMAGLAAAVVLGIAAIYLLVRGAAWLFVGLAVMFLTLAPSFAIALRDISETPVAERYLYLPSAGFAIIVGGLVSWAMGRGKMRWPVGAAVVLLTGSYAVGTVLRGQVWLDNEALWKDATEKEPNEGLPWFQLGTTYFEKNQPARAIEMFDKALAVNDDAEGKSLAWNSKGVAYIRLGKIQDAAQAFGESIKIRPTYATPYFNLGMLGMNKVEQEYAQKKTYDLELLMQAKGAFQQAIKFNPNYTKAYLGLGKCLAKTGAAHLQGGATRQAIDALQQSRQQLELLIQLDPRGVGKDAQTTLNAFTQQLQQVQSAGGAATQPAGTP